MRPATAAALLGGLALLLLPAAAPAAITTFGSSLAAPASLNTTDNLNYKGTDTQVPGAVIHTSHYGADTALWNTTAAAGASAPEPGQVLKVSLEGCAQQPQGAPSPLTQIHFQILSPQPGGGAKVELTSGAFDIPVCGQNGAGATTVSTYELVNMCVSQGDYVAFNDEGGYSEPYYRAGVPYQVIGSVQGSVMDSYIKAGGTGNGSTFSPSDMNAMEGFAANQNEELMLKATLGTGPDARYVCPGGTKEAPPAPRPSFKSIAQAKALLEPVALLRQHDGVNHARSVGVAIYCRLAPRCAGTAVLSSTNGRIRYGGAHFSVAKGTDHVSVRLTPKAMAQLRRHHGHLTARLTVTVNGRVARQIVWLY
jgi:hypothetical protein